MTILCLKYVKIISLYYVQHMYAYIMFKKMLKLCLLRTRNKKKKIVKAKTSYFYFYGCKLESLYFGMKNIFNPFFFFVI